MARIGRQQHSIFFYSCADHFKMVIGKKTISIDHNLMKSFCEYNSISKWLNKYYVQFCIFIYHYFSNVYLIVLGVKPTSTTSHDGIVHHHLQEIKEKNIKVKMTLLFYLNLNNIICCSYMFRREMIFFL